MQFYPASKELRIEPTAHTLCSKKNDELNWFKGATPCVIEKLRKSIAKFLAGTHCVWR